MFNFDDIAGMDDVKEKIREAIVYPFKYQAKNQSSFKAKSSSILLYGPPGCGKTMFATAAANECGAFFVNFNLCYIKEFHLGESRKLIEKAIDDSRSHENVILFFDEICAQRHVSIDDPELGLLTDILNQMDDFQIDEPGKKSTKKRYLIAATYRPWNLSSELLERFDKKIFIQHPDYNTRKKFFEIILKDRPCNADISKLAEITKGYASAEIVYICDHAAKIPLRETIIEGKPKREITMQDFENVITSKESMLTSWYSTAMRELAYHNNAEMFPELIVAANAYFNPETQVGNSDKKITEYSISANIEKIIADTDIKAPVLEAVLQIAQDISRGRRDEKPIGIAFMVGDSENVLARSKQVLPNLMENSKLEERMITNPEFMENIKELAHLDGFFVISGNGVVEAVCRYFNAESMGLNSPSGYGLRYNLVAAMTMATKSVGIVVSQSRGRITIIKGGGFVKSFSP